ncbi:toll/interleukin-1 receptor domain-containing protein [Pseudoalteromonas sp. SCSIO 43101]|uniref:toll/interleukin-1 receptor domain-containing protein n=1 Tax=Pseudoalteromonas sp. SCSIO 43101 TaxID=2822847 RepID=UPI00202B168F|nr:toll/interleukin-1 receptor domain-containing protein [Pseudoalteromonas sp. SCSIO 43101]URQ90087.1 toll/interleukin-1 receptor domain-containing protein [Pseudoalteromonas sp. SCSIO 43101]
MNKLFLSYSSADKVIASSLKASFERNGYQVWFDQANIATGDHYADCIPKGLKESDLFLVLCTKNSMGDARINFKGSKEIIKELELANRLGLKILRLKADDTPDSAFDDAYQYHLSIIQWEDICAAVALGDYTSIVPKIMDRVTGENTESLDSLYIKQVISALKTKNTSEALTILESHHFQGENKDEVKYLFLMAKLQSQLKAKPLNRLTKIFVDNCACEFYTLMKTNMMTAAAYSLAILSRHFYEENCIADATEGFEKLRAQARSSGRVKAKYKRVAETILPANNRFSLDWDF